MLNLTSEESPANIALFYHPEEIWFWYCHGQKLRQASTHTSKNSYIERPCHIDDIMRIVMKLRFAGQLKQKHLDTLLHYGEQFSPPDPRASEEKQDAKIWQEALEILEIPFREKGFLYGE